MSSTSPSASPSAFTGLLVDDIRKAVDYWLALGPPYGVSVDVQDHRTATFYPVYCDDDAADRAYLFARELRHLFRAICSACAVDGVVEVEVKLRVMEHVSSMCRVEKFSACYMLTKALAPQSCDVASAQSWDVTLSLCVCEQYADFTRFGSSHPLCELVSAQP